VSSDANLAPQSPGQCLIAYVVLWLCGASLRLTILAIPPLVPLLHEDLHLTESGIGVLSSLPPLMFSIAAIPGALLISRFGIKSTLVMGLLLTALFSAARGAILDVRFLYVTTIAMAAGVAIMQPALPPLVRTWFPRRIGFATAIYTNGLLVGEVLAAALTLPLVLPLASDSWRLSLAIWAVPVLATALLVITSAPHIVAHRNPNASQTSTWWPDWKHPLTWRLGLLFGSVNATYFTANAFLPDYMTEAGRADLIGPALTALNLCQVPASLLMLVFAGRLVMKPLAYAATGTLSFLALIGIIAMKGTAIVFCAGLLGFANSTTMVLALALPSVLSAPHDVHRTAAGMLTISYACAMALSVITGFLWDATHWPIMGFLPIGICVLLIPLLATSVVGPRHPHDGKETGAAGAGALGE
jgi:CP family cyanate transporter-like MFS transporter